MRRWEQLHPWQRRPLDLAQGKLRVGYPKSSSAARRLGGPPVRAGRVFRPLAFANACSTFLPMPRGLRRFHHSRKLHYIGSSCYRRQPGPKSPSGQRRRVRRWEKPHPWQRRPRTESPEVRLRDFAWAGQPSLLLHRQQTALIVNFTEAGGRQCLGKNMLSAVQIVGIGSPRVQSNG